MWDMMCVSESFMLRRRLDTCARTFTETDVHSAIRKKARVIPIDLRGEELRDLRYFSLGVCYHWI